MLARGQCRRGPQRSRVRAAARRSRGQQSGPVPPTGAISSPEDGAVVVVLSPGQDERWDLDAGQCPTRRVDERVEDADQRDRVAASGLDPVFDRLFRGAG